MSNPAERDDLSPSLRRLLSAIDFITEWQGMIFSSFIVLATFQVCYELVRRYVFHAPTVWGLEMTVYLCATTYVMAGAYAERFKAHIRVDIFYNRWSQRVQACFDLFVTDVLFFFFCGLLVWHGIDWFWEAVREGSTSGTIWDPPIWPMRLVIVLGALGLFIAGVGRAARDLVTAVRGVRVE